MANPGAELTDILYDVLSNGSILNYFTNKIKKLRNEDGLTIKDIADSLMEGKNKSAFLSLVPELVNKLNDTGSSDAFNKAIAWKLLDEVSHDKDFPKDIKLQSANEIDSGSSSEPNTASFDPYDMPYTLTDIPYDSKAMDYAKRRLSNLAYLFDKTKDGKTYLSKKSNNTLGNLIRQYKSGSSELDPRIKKEFDLVHNNTWDNVFNQHKLMPIIQFLREPEKYLVKSPSIKMPAPKRDAVTFYPSEDNRLGVELMNLLGNTGRLNKGVISYDPVNQKLNILPVTSNGVVPASIKRGIGDSPESFKSKKWFGTHNLGTTNEYDPIMQFDVNITDDGDEPSFGDIREFNVPKKFFKTVKDKNGNDILDLNNIADLKNLLYTDLYGIANAADWTWSPKDFSKAGRKNRNFNKWSKSILNVLTGKGDRGTKDYLLSKFKGLPLSEVLGIINDFGLKLGPDGQTIYIDKDSDFIKGLDNKDKDAFSLQAQMDKARRYRSAPIIDALIEESGKKAKEAVESGKKGWSQVEYTDADGNKRMGYARDLGTDYKRLVGWRRGNYGTPIAKATGKGSKEEKLHKLYSALEDMGIDFDNEPLFAAAVGSKFVKSKMIDALMDLMDPKKTINLGMDAEQNQQWRKNQVEDYVNAIGTAYRNRQNKLQQNAENKQRADYILGDERDKNQKEHDDWTNVKRLVMKDFGDFRAKAKKDYRFDRDEYNTQQSIYNDIIKNIDTNISKLANRLDSSKPYAAQLLEIELDDIEEQIRNLYNNAAKAKDFSIRDRILEEQIPALQRKTNYISKELSEIEEQTDNEYLGDVYNIYMANQAKRNKDKDSEQPTATVTKKADIPEGKGVNTEYKHQKDTSADETITVKPDSINVSNLAAGIMAGEPGFENGADSGETNMDDQDSEFYEKQLNEGWD